jgi:hypothetical protein
MSVKILSQNIQTGYETHPASQIMNTKGAFYRAQGARDEGDQSFPSKAKFVNSSAPHT